MKKYIVISMLLLNGLTVGAQESGRWLSLQTAIKIAKENSFDAQSAKFSFMASYWTYRSFKAQLLPAVNLHGSLMQFDHSLVEARNYETGQVKYVDNNSLSNNLTLSIDQEIVATGGRISLQSYLYRLDQFDYDITTYNSQPLRINYSQPLRAFNALKWEKKIAPMEYEIAQRKYLSRIEAVAQTTTNFFFNALAAQREYQQSIAARADREQLLQMAQKRLELGTTTKSEVLQLELSVLNARVAVSKQKLSLEDRLYQLYSYLRVTDYEGVSLIAPDSVPEILLDMDLVLQKAVENSSYALEQKTTILQSERSLAQAKANKGLQLSLHGEVGLSKTSDSFSAAYSRLRDNEIVGLTLSLPIFDWGVSKGRVEMAKAQLEVVRTQQEQEYLDYMQGLRKKVQEFNSHLTLFRDAKRAQEISAERYDITLKRFETGTVTVTELNTAQQEQESARMQYINQIHSFWADYYALQQYTLYDWIERKDITIDNGQLTMDN